ncbi:MAG: N-acetylmuramoyl-L-alanine amidase [candidate division KSB1 bacterium]|nr:N-acetylmuramoyl-L-alanine amidase [candidate division KSB1 bacterium]MDZ7272874.1 N-acetylmuramoyl-L-alanine amidase [candidate division KSB1 bacterium]MDZ7284103.1 N-acetylmuramoyl-L-alanine amidase [candidate division KSB1 bacterium]MDZ7297499.1 N-acetylmuramoyl-L-alanine amidase [candidate division KSB1 bacterium]MDZ7305635.1 N-acetylmuramoyl-L-alanine amidase [candidate division KSB1 bacterium]
MIDRNILRASLLLSCFFLHCGGAKLVLREWTELPAEHYTIPPHAQYLAAYKIALDPGHGGLSHLPGYKRGPSGKQEAVMNLNVALELRHFLERAGATVVLTRPDDRYVSLAERAAIAERAGCDFLISLHHNAADDPRVNYVSVYYHLYPDYSPASMDLARNIYFGLVEALRLPQVANDGLLSDKMIYPDGFGLLRRIRLPAVLLESSFFSNPAEEKRLMDRRYNRREAYGIFLGLARWAAGGVPSARRLQPAKIARDPQPEVVYQLADGITERGGRGAGQLLLFSNSVSLRVDGRPVPAHVDLTKGRLWFRPDSAWRNGVHVVQIELQNLFKNHNLPVRDTLIIAAPAAAIAFAAPMLQLPADGVAVLPITLTLRDGRGEAVWDGTPVSVRAERGQLLDSLRLHEGSGTIYYQAANEPGPVQLIAAADGHQDTLRLELVPAGQLVFFSGLVRDDSTAAALAGVAISLNDAVWATTDANGGFFLTGVPAGSYRFAATKAGYSPAVEMMAVDSLRSVFVRPSLRPVLRGVLHQQTIIVDAALGGKARGDRFTGGVTAAAANFAAMAALADSLRWTGANAILVRTNDTTDLALDARIALVNQVPQGWYLKWEYRRWDSDSLLVQTTIYPGNQQGEQLALAINQAFAALPNTRVVLRRNTDVPEVLLTNKTAVAVQVRCRAPQVHDREVPALFRGIVNFHAARRRQAALPEEL